MDATDDSQPLLEPDRQSPSMPGSVDAEAMKAQVRESLTRAPYNVHDFYNETGCCQAVARHRFFQTCTTLSIVSYMVLSTFHSVLADRIMLGVFASLWFVRLAAFKRKMNCLRDSWFLYDGLIVLLMALGQCAFIIGNTTPFLEAAPVVMLAPALVGHLARLSPEVAILIKGLYAAARSVFCSLLLLTLVVFAFGVIFDRACQDTMVGEKYFDSLRGAMYTLLTHGILLDGVAALGSEIYQESGFLTVCFFIFVFLAIFLLVMSLMLGCEVISAVAAAEKEELETQYVQSHLTHLVSDICEDGEGCVSQRQLSQMLAKPDAARVFEALGVDVCHLIDLSANFFEGPVTKITFDELVELVMKLRGSQKSTVKDIVELRSNLDARMDRIERMISSLANRQ